MKSINVTFEDEEFTNLELSKQDMSWREFILTLVEPKEKWRKRK